MKQLLTFLSVLIFSTGWCQNFEGVLKYKMNLEVGKAFESTGLSKQMVIDKMKAEGLYLDEETVSYKDGNYCMSIVSGKRIWSIYKRADNKLYSFQEGSDECAVTDVSVDLEASMLGKKPEVRLIDTAVLVYNKLCKIVRVKWSTGYYDYYFNSEFLPMSPELFSNHLFDGWAEYLKISKSLPLQIVKSVNGMMTVTVTLTDVQAKSLEPSVFALPELQVDKDAPASMISNKVMMKIKK